MGMGPEDIRRVHLEMTTRCNAACPMCARSPFGLPNQNLRGAELRLDEIRHILPNPMVLQLEEVMFCGNYGDPAVAADLLPVLSHLRSVNPALRTSVLTNGGVRSAEFWATLAGLADLVVFGIDGLEDTNAIYRQNVEWPRLMRNVKAYIDAGGRAQWQITVFRHNEHQIPQVEALARELGFESVSVRRTNRFQGLDGIEVTVPRSSVPVRIEPPRRAEHRNTSDQHIADLEREGKLDEIRKEADLDCSYTNKREVFIDAHGRLFPCCYWGATVYAPWPSADADAVTRVIEADPSGLAALSLHEHTFAEVHRGHVFSTLDAEMAPGPARNQMCATRCSGTMRLESDTIGFSDS